MNQAGREWRRLIAVPEAFHTIVYRIEIIWKISCANNRRIFRRRMRMRMMQHPKYGGMSRIFHWIHVPAYDCVSVSKSNENGAVERQLTTLSLLSCIEFKTARIGIFTNIIHSNDALFVVLHEWNPSNRTWVSVMRPLQRAAVTSSNEHIRIHQTRMKTFPCDECENARAINVKMDFFFRTDWSVLTGFAGIRRGVFCYDDEVEGGNDEDAAAFRLRIRVRHFRRIIIIFRRFCSISG